MRKTCPRCTAIINMDEPLCAGCKQRDNQRRAGKSRRHGINTSSWQRFRLGVLTRDGHQCQECGARAVPLSLHYKPGGIHTRNPNDYTTLCLSCHGRVDAPRSALSR